MKLLLLASILAITSFAQTDGAYKHYRIVVTKNSKDGNNWCLGKFPFYDTNGNQIMVDPWMGSAETFRSSTSGPDRAFNQYPTYFYCSDLGHPTGWLAYEFPAPVTLSRYGLMSAKGQGTNVPEDWTFEGSNDGISWETLDEQSGYDSWHNGQLREFDLESTKVNTDDTDYCVECTCRGWERISGRYYDCLRRSRKDCKKGFCVRCQQDGVTPMPGFWTSHDDECTAYSDRVRNGDGAYKYYKFNVLQTKNNYWCLTELSFYGDDGEKLVLDTSRASAYTSGYPDGGTHVFDLIETTDVDGSYCSATQMNRGWVMYEFPSPKKLSKYVVKVWTGTYGPLQWKFEGSIDGNSWTILDEQSLWDNQWTKTGEVREFEIKQTEVAVSISRPRVKVLSDSVIGTTHINAITIFAIIGALAMMYHCVSGIHKIVFETKEFQKINKDTIEC